MAGPIHTEQSTPPDPSLAKPQENPYVGPRALRYGESIYGRERESGQLLELLIAERIVLLYSPSGAGKTSLIQAALKPALEKEEFRVLPVIRVSRAAVEGTYPCNPYVMSALLSMEEGVPTERALAPERLAAMQFGEYLDHREAVEGGSTFLIFDQFEEILTFDPLNREAKADFFNQVGTALRDLKRWALFAMREDHVAALDPYLRPIPTRLKATFRLDLLNADSARLAVQEPARRSGITFTEEATTKLVDDLREVAVQGPTGAPEQKPGLYIEPVQLQVVCYRLWENLAPGVTEISAELVTGSGDVDTALAEYYAERVRHIAEKTGVKERLIRDWFDRRLITDSGIRSQVMQGSESSQGLDNKTIAELVNVHLVRPDERRGVTWLELAHDRLVKPIRADNTRWSKKNLNVLQHQAAVWHQQSRQDALCLRAEALVAAHEWAAAHPGELTPIEREFLEVCERNQDARDGKRLRARVAKLTAVMTCLSILAGVALFQWRSAKHERDNAKRQTSVAIRERAEAEKQRGEADKHRTEAEVQGNRATARSIAGYATQLADERLDSALLLAIEAERIAGLPDTRGSLLNAAYFNPRLITFLHDPPSAHDPGSQISALAFSPDGRQLVTGGFNHRLVQWDISDLRGAEDTIDLAALNEHRPGRLLDALVGDAVRAIAFSPDGKYLAVASKDGSLVLCVCGNETEKEMLLPPQPPPGPGEDPANVWSVAFSADSTLLAASDWQGRVFVWDLVAKKRIDPPKPIADNPAAPDQHWEVRAVAFNRGSRPFADADFTNVFATIRMLSSTTEPAAASLWQHFSKTAREQLVGPPKPPFDPSSFFIGELNRIISGASLATDPSIAAAPFSEATRQVIATNPPPGFASRVNRLIVEDILGANIARKLGTRTLLAAGCGEGSIVLWMRAGDQWIEVGRETADHPGSSRRINCMAFSPTGAFIAVGRMNERVAIVPLDDSGMKMQHDHATEARHEGALTGVAFSPDGSRLISSSYDGTARMWKVPGLTPDGPPLTGHVGRVFAVAFSGDGRLAATGGMDRKTILWDTWKAGARPRSDRGSGSFTMALSPDGALDAEGYESDSVLVGIRDHTRNTRTSVPVASASETDGPISTIAFCREKRLLVSSTRDLTVRLHDLANLPSPPPEPVIFSPEKFTLWEKPEDARITATAISADGKLIAAAVTGKSAKAAIFVWDRDTGAAVFDPPLICPDDEIFTLQFSPNGALLASGGDAEKLVIWSIASEDKGRATICPEIHTGKIRSIAFDTAGKIIATAAGDNTLILWSAPDGAQLAPPMTGHQAPVIAVAFSPDGKLLASGSDDTSVMLWDVASKRPAARLMGHSGKVQALAFDVEGRVLFSGSWEDEIKTWQLDPEALRRACRNRANRDITPEERRVYLEDR